MPRQKVELPEGTVGTQFVLGHNRTMPKFKKHGEVVLVVYEVGGTRRYRIEEAFDLSPDRILYKIRVRRRAKARGIPEILKQRRMLLGLPVPETLHA